MSFPQIPDKVKLFGRTLDVVREEMPSPSDNEETWGCWHEISQTISINDKIPPDSMAAWTTLIHEVLHAIDSVVALEGDMSEKDIDRIAAGVLSFLIENEFLRDAEAVKKRRNTKDGD